MTMAIVATLATLTATSVTGSASSVASSPVSVTVLASGEGWQLADYHCGHATCVRIEHASNVKGAWVREAVPPALQTLMRTTASDYYPNAQFSIYFTNAEDGWIYGSAQNGGPATTFDAALWSTHDAGHTWSPVPVQSLGMRTAILSVSASHGQVYALGWNTDQTFGLWRSAISTDAWHRVQTPTLPPAAGGGSMQGAFVFKGHAGWLMVGNDRGVTGAARLTSSGHWVTWAGPCARVGGTFAVPVAYSSTTLVDDCTIGGFGGDVARTTPKSLKMNTSWIFTSRDGGLDFTPTREVSVGIRTMWLVQVPGLPASPAPGVILVEKPINKGQTSPEHLFATNNGGRTWRSVYTPSQPTATIQLITFASPRLGVAIVQVDASTSYLVISTDGGRTWRRSAT
jgi:hypothetical protein